MKKRILCIVFAMLLGNAVGTNPPPTSAANFENKVSKGVTHKKYIRNLNGKPAAVNVLVVNTSQGSAVVKPSFGTNALKTAMSVKQITKNESAIAGINASYFKPNESIPIGLSVIDGELKSGPLFKRVAMGITDDNKFITGKPEISGRIEVNNSLKLSLFNINQPAFSRNRFSVFTDKYGYRTPKTGIGYSHILIVNGKIRYAKNSSIPIQKGSFAIVGPSRLVSKKIKIGDDVKVTFSLTPNEWNSVKYAVSGGPYLVRNGKVFIDRQKFSRSFLWTKAPRTAIGKTKSGNLLLVTVDGRQRNKSEGATISELAKIMKELGADEAINLDGGTSTQMVVNGRIVNTPTVRGGGKVNNALVIVTPYVNN